MYLLKLANGINPLDDRPVGTDEVLNNERIRKCLAYAAEVLDKSAGGENSQPTVRKSRSKQEFSVSRKDAAKIPVSSAPMRISQFTAVINDAVCGNGMKKLQSRMINAWLVEKGFLKNSEEFPGKHHREVTERSQEIGIEARQEMGVNGPYTAIVYHEKAQRFIIDHLSEIVEFSAKEEPLCQQS